MAEHACVCVVAESREELVDMIADRPVWDGPLERKLSQTYGGVLSELHQWYAYVDPGQPQAWFVEESYDFQGTTLHGIYTTKDAAIEAATRLPDASVAEDPVPLNAKIGIWMGN